MNTNKIIVVSVVTVLALLVVGGGIAFAQSGGPGWGMGGNGVMGGYSLQNGTPAPGYGMISNNHGMMGNGSGMTNGVDMNAMHQWMSTTSGMHTTVWNGLAEALGLTPEELNAQFASGQTLAQIAVAQGVSQEELAATLEASVKAGLERAVADGVLTQAQADQKLSQKTGNFGWMIAQMGANMGAGMGFGPNNSHGANVPQSN